MVQQAGMKLQEKVMDKHLHPFDAWNELQPHILGKLGWGFGELFIATNLSNWIKELKNQANIGVMTKVLELFLVSWVLLDSGRFREYDYMSTQQIHELQDKCVHLCYDLKPHCIKLSDTFGSKE